MRYASLIVVAAGIVAALGSVIPKASIKHWVVFAVPICSQAPGVAQAAHLSTTSGFEI